MKEICKAMSEAFPKIEGALKDKENPHYKSKYADLGNVIAAIKPALEAHGLWFIQQIHDKPGYASVETVIMHASGESLSGGIISVPVSKNDAQGFGSALTYARRYSLSAAFGVAPEDDDGNAACETPPRRPEPPKKQEPKIETPKLGQEEIDSLAKEISNTLMEDNSLECIIYEKEFANYLAIWQTKFPLSRESLANTCSSHEGREKILKSFVNWQNKQEKRVSA